jgi:hypothetical protein
MLPASHLAPAAGTPSLPASGQRRTFADQDLIDLGLIEVCFDGYPGQGEGVIGSSPERPVNETAC